MAFIALFLPSLEDGGAERAFVELANEFVALGHRVDLVLAARKGPYFGEVDPRVTVIDLGSDRWPLVVARLAAYLRRTGPDVIMSGIDTANVANVMASTAAGMRSRCVVSQRAVIHDVYRLERPRTWRAWLSLLGVTYRRARLVICNSGAAAAEAVQHLAVDPRRVAVILNAVDMERIETLAREPITDPWAGSAPAPLIVSVGSLSKRKDMGTLLHALARVRATRPCNLVILGEGPERESLEALVRRLGLESAVRLPGFAHNPFPWMAAADVFVSASLAEGCPNVIQQALACGTPIVATDCPGGTAEVLENGRWGRLVPTREPDAMATAILAALADPARPDGRMRARDFDGRVTARRYLQLLLPEARPAALLRALPVQPELQDDET